MIQFDFDSGFKHAMVVSSVVMATEKTFVWPSANNTQLLKLDKNVYFFREENTVTTIHHIQLDKKKGTKK